MHGIGFLADKASAYNVGDNVRIYAVTRTGLLLPLDVIGRVVAVHKHQNGAVFPLWFYDITTDDRVYTGIPANRIASYTGPMTGSYEGISYLPERYEQGSPLAARPVIDTHNL